MIQTKDTSRLTLDLEGKLPFTRQTLRGESVTILGRKGMGKSNTVSVFAEELLEKQFPLVIVDPQDEYYGLAEKYTILRVGRSPNCVLPLDPEKAGALAEYSLTQNMPVILSLYHYNQDERFTLLRGYFERLWALEEEYKKPYMVLLEEAHKYLPEGGTTPVTSILNDIFLLGRKNGLGTILATQRSAKISKDTISQSGIYVLHKVIHPADINVYLDLIPLPKDEAKAMIRRQRKGGAIVLYDDDSLPEDVPSDVLIEVRIRPQHTYHAGATPTFDEGAKPALLQLDEHLLQELRQLLTQAPPDISAGESKLQRQITALEKQLAEQEIITLQLHEDLAMKEATIRELEQQRDILGRITVLFPDRPLTPIASSEPQIVSIDQAHVRQVLFGSGQDTPVFDQLTSKEMVSLIEALRLELFSKIATIQEMEQRLPALKSEAVEGNREAKKVISTTQLTQGQTTLVGDLIEQINALDTFQRQLFLLLIQGEGEISLREIATRLRITLAKLMNRRTTQLKDLGLVKRTNKGYQSNLLNYCRERLQGANASVVRESLQQYVKR